MSHCALAWISREGHTCYCSKSYHIMELQKPCTYVLTIKNAQADQSLARSGLFAQEHERPSKGSCKYNCGHRFDLERSASVVRSGCSRSGPASTCAKLRARGSLSIGQHSRYTNIDQGCTSGFFWSKPNCLIQSEKTPRLACT